MKTTLTLMVILICTVGYAQNVTTVRKPVLKVFSGNYDSKEPDKTNGRMKLEIRQAKAVISGTLNYKSNDGNMTELKISGYVQNNKAHVQISDTLTVSVNGESALLQKNTVLLRI